MQERSFVFTALIFALVATGFSIACHRCTPASKAKASASLESDFKIPYNLETPSLLIPLKDISLQEISGLSATPEKNIFCSISDEKGEFYLLDLKDSGKITRRVTFKEKGDFEGIEMVGEVVYAIKSNGNLYEISNWKNNDAPTIKEYSLDIGGEHDIEGLSFDKKRNMLLIGSKEDPESDTKRFIWGFDLTTKQLIQPPLYSINPNDIDAIVEITEDDKSRHFSTSGVAVQPISGDLYLISTALKRLAIMDYSTGRIKASVRINKDILQQPEGIAFDAEGNLYISSEAKKGEAAIAIFNLLKL
jgi:uncharacterized protein YjiK